MKTTVLIGLFFCHFLADFTPLSTPWMLKAKFMGTPLFPIFIHAMVHTFLMMIWMISVIGYSDLIIFASIFQLISHFIIDVAKGKLNYHYPALRDPINKSHWFIFGLDQFLHTLVIIIISTQLKYA